MKLSIFTLLVTSLILFGCGNDPESDNSKAQDNGQVTHLKLEGNVVSAFELTVDNTSYADIEDYYSYVSRNLPSVNDHEKAKIFDLIDANFLFIDG